MYAMDDVVRAWGARIKARREALAQTQRDLAAAAGTTQQYLSQLERGAVEPGLDLKRRLAAALSTPVDRLFPYPEDLQPAAARSDSIAP